MVTAGFRSDLFFGELVAHLRGRARFVRSLAVMAATERWVQFEATALLDANRRSYGLSEPAESTSSPSWWITCEYKRCDIWLERTSPDANLNRGISIELKAVHNNKNFNAKLRELRRDLSIDKALPLPEACVERHGILVGTFVRYVDGHGSRYPIRARITDVDAFRSQIEDALGNEDNSYGRTPPATLIAWESVTSLGEAPYVDSKQGECGVWLGLVRAVGR